MIVLVITIQVTWPSTVEDPSGDLVFEGEVWGDLTTEGVIWGEHVSEFDYVDFGFWSASGEENLRVSVTNVSQIWLIDRHNDTNISVPCTNGSFEIITNSGSLDVYLSDLEFRCEYLEFIGIFPGDEEDYGPTVSISSVEGHGYLTNGRAIEWHQHEGFDLDGCLIVVDGVEYREIHSLLIPDGETAYVEVEGSVDFRGGIRVSGGLRPHVNGTLEVWNFLHKKDDRSQLYERITFEGEDIYIKHNGGSQTGTGGMFRWFDQWGINVTISPDTTVLIEEAPQTPLWAEVIMIALVAILIVFTVKMIRGLRSKMRTNPMMETSVGDLR
jgi:hypothetical protein